MGKSIQYFECPCCGFLKSEKDKECPTCKEMREKGMDKEARLLKAKVSFSKWLEKQR